MKKILLMLFVLTSTLTFAQNGMPPGGMPPGGMPPGGMPPGGKPEEMKPNFKKKMSTDEMVVKMTEELHLNELQQLQTREIFKDLESKSSFDPTKIKTGERPNFQEIKEKMETQKQELTARLAKILNEDQLKKWIDESDSWKSKKQ
jgi:uncharacterized sporulation protein YeaH/YhbH (DUF444 family)